MKYKTYLILGAILAGTATIMGAFGAHALKGVLNAHQLTTYNTAVKYQFIHSIAIIFSAFLGFGHKYRMFKYASNLFAAGVLFFCGSLYGLAFSSWGILGPLTPIGGLLLILGWFVLAFACYQIKED